MEMESGTARQHELAGDRFSLSETPAFMLKLAARMLFLPPKWRCYDRVSE
jgi:hypothetical protein